MKATSGFGRILIAIIVIVIGFTGAFGWLAWRSYNTGTNNPVANVTQTNKDTPTVSPGVQQGVKGTITIRSGDCMPGASSSCKTGPYTTPTTVIIKQSISQTDKTQKRVIKRIDNVKGEFETDLAPGIYNMYVMVDGREYCNAFGGQNGEDCEFPVTPNIVTPYELQINNATD